MYITVNYETLHCECSEARPYRTVRSGGQSMNHGVIARLPVPNVPFGTGGLRYTRNDGDFKSDVIQSKLFTDFLLLDYGFCTTSHNFLHQSHHLYSMLLHGRRPCLRYSKSCLCLQRDLLHSASSLKLRLSLR